MKTEINPFINHLLLDRNRDTVSEVEPGCDKEHQNTLHYCDNHPTELLRYFGPTHYSLHCGDCIALIKISCKMVKISIVSKNIRNKVEFTELQSKNEKLLKNINGFRSKIYSMKESVLQNEARDLDQVTRHEQKLIEKIKASWPVSKTTFKKQEANLSFS